MQSLDDAGGMRCRPLLCFSRLIHLLRLGRWWRSVHVRTFFALSVNKPNKTFHSGQQTTDRVQIRCRHVRVVSFINRFWAQLFMCAPEQCTAAHNPITPIQQREIQICRRLSRAHHSWTCQWCTLTSVVLVFSFFTLFLRANILDEQACSAQGGCDAHFVENWRQEKPVELHGVVPNLATVNSSDHSQRPAHSNGSQHQTRWRECEAENPKHAE